MVSEQQYREGIERALKVGAIKRDNIPKKERVDAVGKEPEIISEIFTGHFHEMIKNTAGLYQAVSDNSDQEIYAHVVGKELFIYGMDLLYRLCDEKPFRELLNNYIESFIKIKKEDAKPDGG